MTEASTVHTLHTTTPESRTNRLQDPSIAEHVSTVEPSVAPESADESELLELVTAVHRNVDHHNLHLYVRTHNWNARHSEVELDLRHHQKHERQGLQELELHDHRSVQNHHGQPHLTDPRKLPRGPPNDRANSGPIMVVNKPPAATLLRIPLAVPPAIGELEVHDPWTAEPFDESPAWMSSSARAPSHPPARRPPHFFRRGKCEKTLAKALHAKLRKEGDATPGSGRKS